MENPNQFDLDFRNQQEQADDYTTSSPATSSDDEKTSVPWRPPFRPDSPPHLQGTQYPNGLSTYAPQFASGGLPAFSSTSSTGMPFWPTFHQVSGRFYSSEPTGFPSPSSTFPYLLPYGAASSAVNNFSGGYLNSNFTWNAGSEGLFVAQQQMAFQRQQYHQQQTEASARILSPDRPVASSPAQPYFRGQTSLESYRATLESNPDKAKIRNAGPAGKAKTVRDLLIDNDLLEQLESDCEDYLKDHAGDCKSVNACINPQQEHSVRLGSILAMPGVDQDDSLTSDSDLPWNLPFDLFESQANYQNGLFDPTAVDTSAASIPASPFSYTYALQNRQAQNQCERALAEALNEDTASRSSSDPRSPRGSMFSPATCGQSPPGIGTASHLSASYDSSSTVSSSYNGSPASLDLFCRSPMPSSQSFTTPLPAVTQLQAALQKPPTPLRGPWLPPSGGDATLRLAAATKVKRSYQKKAPVDVQTPKRSSSSSARPRCPRPRMFAISELVGGTVSLRADTDATVTRSLFRVKMVFSARKLLYEFESKHVPDLPDDVREKYSMVRLEVPWDTVQRLEQDEDDFYVTLDSHPTVALGYRHLGSGLGITCTKYGDHAASSSTLVNFGLLFRTHKLVFRKGDGSRFREALGKTDLTVSSNNAWKALNLSVAARKTPVAIKTPVTSKTPVAIKTPVVIAPKPQRKRKASEADDSSAVSESAAKRAMESV